MHALDGKRVLLGVTGGIAAYKACVVARALMKEGALVKTMLTRAAERFVTPLTFEALTGQPCLTDDALFAGGPAAHVALGREADLIVIAPATANTIAKLAHGLADNLLTNVVLASTAPVLVCPAMHSQMWLAPPVQENIQRLHRPRFTVMEPDTGDLASSDSGPGRFPEPQDVVMEAAAALTPKDLVGRRIVVTGGPTRERIDVVRFISNPSSGRMGMALAQAAQARGADVTLILGPTEVRPPRSLRPEEGRGSLQVKRVETAQEMLDATREAVVGAHALLMAAAVADERPKDQVGRKLHKGELPRVIEMEPTPDILLSLKEILSGKVVLGFAAESDDLVQSGRQKLEAKGLSLLFANPVGGGKGFGAVENQGVLLRNDGTMRKIGPVPKEELAQTLLDEVAARLK